MANKVRLNLLVEAPEGATLEEVLAFVHDLEWCGGCRDPENDVMFESLTILEGKATKGRSK